MHLSPSHLPYSSPLHCFHLCRTSAILRPSGTPLSASSPTLTFPPSSENGPPRFLRNSTSDQRYELYALPFLALSCFILCCLYVSFFVAFSCLVLSYRSSLCLLLTSLVLSFLALSCLSCGIIRCQCYWPHISVALMCLHLYSPRRSHCVSVIQCCSYRLFHNPDMRACVCGPYGMFNFYPELPYPVHKACPYSLVL